MTWLVKPKIVEHQREGACTREGTPSMAVMAGSLATPKHGGKVGAGDTSAHGNGFVDMPRRSFYDGREIWSGHDEYDEMANQKARETGV